MKQYDLFLDETRASQCTCQMVERKGGLFVAYKDHKAEIDKFVKANNSFKESERTQYLAMQELEAENKALREFVESKSCDPSDCGYDSCKSCPDKNNCYTLEATQLLAALDKDGE